MTGNTVKIAQVGYGMFGSDVVAGSMWDLQRNGISPYLDRIGLDDRAVDYQDLRFEMVAIGTRSEKSARKGCSLNRKNAGIKPLHAEAKAGLSRLDSWQIRHVRREQNSEADSLVNQALDAA